MNEYRPVRVEKNGKTWIDFQRVRITEGKGGELDKVWVMCPPGELMIAPTFAEAYYVIATMNDIQQRSFNNSTIEERMIGMNGHIEEIPNIGRGLDRVGEKAAEIALIFDRAFGRRA